MKPNVKRIHIGFILIILLASCASSNSEQFSIGTEALSNADHGYTPENPVRIWAPTAEARREKVNNFLKGLRSGNGEKLQILEKELVSNPSYKPPQIKI